MRTKIIAVLVVSLLISIMLAKLNLFAQEDKRSLSEAIQFLKDNAEYVSGLGIVTPDGRKWKLESPDDCTLVWTREASNQWVPSGNSYIDNLSRNSAALPTTVTLSLSDVSNINVPSDNLLPVSNSDSNRNLSVGNSNVRSRVYHEVFINATPHRNAVKWRGANGDHDEDDLILQFKSNKMREKYANALRDAVTFCAKPDKAEP